MPAPRTGRDPQSTATYAHPSISSPRMETPPRSDTASAAVACQGARVRRKSTTTGGTRRPARRRGDHRVPRTDGTGGPGWAPAVSTVAGEGGGPRPEALARGGGAGGGGSDGGGRGRPRS